MNTEKAKTMKHTLAVTALLLASLAELHGHLIKDILA